MTEILKGKVAVVTGSGRGIGREEAIALAEAGAMVIVNDNGTSPDGHGASSSPADEVVAEITGKGGRAAANYDSVATPEGAENIIKSAIDHFGRIDILVNNAGVLRNHMIYKIEDEDWDIVLKTHLYGHFYCTKHACIHFRQQRSGRIINTSSTAGLGQLGSANYSAAKEGITGFTYTVALEMEKYGVTCNALCPMAITRGWDKSLDDAEKKGVSPHPSFPGITRSSLNAYPPEMVAPIVVYLASDEASDITGRVFLVGGGELGVFVKRELKKQIIKQGMWTFDELVKQVPKLVD